MRFHSPHIALCCVFIIHISSFITGNAQTPLVVHGTPKWAEGRDIGQYVQFYKDKARKPLILNQVQALKTFRPYTQKRDERRTDSDVAVIITWLKFQIQNTHPSDTAKFFMMIGAHAKIYVYQGQQLTYESGVSLSAKHPNTSTHSVLYVALDAAPAKTTTFWVQVIDYESSPMPVMTILNTFTTAALSLLTSNYNSLYLMFSMSILVGCLLFMTFYTLYYFWLTRDAAFGYYALYVAAATLATLMGIEGRFQLQILRNIFFFLTTAKSGLAIIDFNFIIPIFYIIFIAKFLDLAKNQRTIWQILKGLIVVLILQQTLAIYQLLTEEYFYSNTYYIYKNITPFAATLLLLYASIRSQNPVKGYLITGIVIVLVFVFVNLFFRFHFKGLPLYSPLESIVNLTMFRVYLGLTLEALFFAFALAYRARLVEVEKNQMQIRYSEQLERQLAFRTKEIHAQSQMLEEQHIRQLESDFEQRIAETEMTALRAQMNPHFIFNCLNSIKLYTLENDALAASDYLTKFSRLIRLVLENSRSEKVTLENELETLELYIEMEAMRFKNKVRYTIEVDEDIDPQYVEIPPLLLQPYVENAIWHGLMHREEGGTVQIAIETLHASSLQVTITDDGIGRVAAAELKSKSATKNKSFGLKMTSERIEIINQLYKTNTNVTIEDLYDSNGQAAGTKVLITIPI